MQDELQDQVVYGEHQIRYLQDEIENEQRYRRRAKEEQKDNQKKVSVGYVVCYLLFLGLMLISGWAMIFSKTSPNFLLPIFLIFALPVMIFMVIFFAFFGARMVKYIFRIRGDVDRKTFAYKRYKDMEQDSKAREQYLKKELIKTEMTREMNLELIKQRQQQIAMEEMKTIDIEELRHIQLEKQDAAEETVDEKNMGRLLEEGEVFQD
jgi:heme/copper-type cytochrome/quinol oxidase subunit 4